MIGEMNMYLTDDREKKEIFDWANRNNIDFNNDAEMKLNTYFNDFDNTDNIREFDYESIADLLNEFDMMWDEKDSFNDIKVVCAVAALKRMPRQRVELGEKSSDEMIIPDFVYAF